MPNERFEREMAKRQEKIKVENKARRKFVEEVLPSLELPTPLPEGHVPNEKFQKLMEERKQRLEEERVRTKELFDNLTDADLPVLIQPEKKNKKKSS